LDFFYSKIKLVEKTPLLFCCNI